MSGNACSNSKSPLPKKKITSRTSLINDYYRRQKIEREMTYVWQKHTYEYIQYIIW